jgi:hypothetical protein
MKRSRRIPDEPKRPDDYLEPLVRALGDPAVLAGIRVAELEPVAFQLALYFGVRRDADTAAALGGVYERLVRDVTLEARTQWLEDLAAAVAGGATSVLALLPVLQRETSAALVRSAALTFATRMSGTPEDPLAGPRALRSLLDHAEHDASRAGLVGALLALGDARVRPLLAGAWHTLTPGAASALLALPRAHASRLEAEWLLDWLEDADPATFEAVAASLARLPAAGRGRVLELARELPSGPDGDALTVQRAWDPAELGEVLAERFRSLARRSEAPAAFDAVLAAWGVPR